MPPELFVFNTKRPLMTPETHPNHETIGRRFKGWDGNIYFCDSYDPDIGFWMTRVDAPEGVEPRRANVSERAIGRSYHRIYGKQTNAE